MSNAGAVHFLLLGVSESPVGGYKVVYEYANALAELGVETHVWHSTAYYALPATRRRVSGRRGVKRVKAAGRAMWTRLRLRRRLVRWFDLDPRVHAHLTAGLPSPRLSASDVVIATAIETTAYAGRLAARAGARSAALIQHLETWSASRADIVDAWSQVDERIVIAPWLEKECTDAGLSSILIPNAVDAGAFPPGPPLAGRAPGILTLLSPHGYKRPDVVLAALRAVHAGSGHAGSAATALVAFGQSAPPADLPEYVTYHRQPDAATLAQLYRSATVYLCGSDAEGWHLPPAEATLAGAAVVSTDIGGVRVSMEDDALYAPAGDGAELARLALGILAAPAPAQSRVDRARERLLARTITENARTLLAAVRGAGAVAS